MSNAKFEKAVAIVQGLPKDGPVQPTQDDKLYFYSYYKQGTIGDVNTTRPGMLDFVGKAKWDAWNALKGTSTADAQQKYIDKLEAVRMIFDVRVGSVVTANFSGPCALVRLGIQVLTAAGDQTLLDELKAA